jgi:Tfp pilus assembly protein FimV
LRWTLAEAYLKAGETESARTLLERLEAAPEPWHARAVDRLRSIR